MERRKMVCMDVEGSYYDMRDILACKQNLKCLFPNAVAEEIFHLIGQKAPEMEGGFCRADLPLFMVKTIPNCKIVPPVEFNRVQMQILHAAPEHVNIMHLNQFYFILSKHIAKLLTTENGRSLAETVLFSFLQRSGWILNRALHLGTKSEKFDSSEIQLYEEALKCATYFTRWFNSRQAISRKRGSSHFN